MGDLGRRVAVAAVGIPLGIGIIYLGGWLFTAVVAALAAVGTYEVYNLASHRGWRPFAWLGLPVAALLVAWALPAGGLDAWAPGAFSLLLLLALGSLAAAVFRRGPGGDPLLAAGTTLLGVCYAAVPMAFAVLLRELPEEAAGAASGPVAAAGWGGAAGWDGALLVMFPLVVTWLADTAAYFTGIHLGRRKLIPSVSPAKTVAGSVGGLAAAVGGAVLYALLFLGPDRALSLPVGWAAVGGLLLGVAGQIGDLAESVLKREAGVKDSGAILPGHGGVLDRFDGVYFTVPLTYALFLVALT